MRRSSSSRGQSSAAERPDDRGGDAVPSEDFARFLRRTLARPAFDRAVQREHVPLTTAELAEARIVCDLAARRCDEALPLRFGADRYRDPCISTGRTVDAVRS